jgi:hypothetical protein
VRTLTFALVVWAAGATSAHAQIRPSQLGSVSQSLGDARIDIRYRRPVARGRELFGVLVPWGRVWSPSSDTAAVFTVTGPVRVNGERLAAGTYSLWTIPDSASWTVIFTTAHPTFHTRYREGGDALRVRAVPRTGEHAETLAFYFPMVDADSAQLVLHWGRTVVPLDIRLDRR